MNRPNDTAVAYMTEEDLARCGEPWCGKELLRRVYEGDTMLFTWKQFKAAYMAGAKAAIKFPDREEWQAEHDIEEYLDFEWEGYA